MYFKVLRNGKPANSSCRQPKGKAFFQSTGHFRQVFSWISRNSGSSGLKTAGLQQSGAKHFGKRQDCSNPEPNSSGNGRIAAIRSQTLRETAKLQQSGAKLFGKRQDCSNPEPNSSGNGRIAAIRSQTLLETARLRQSGIFRTGRAGISQIRAFPKHGLPLSIPQ